MGRFGKILFALALGTLVFWSTDVSKAVLPMWSINHDEVVYRRQAQTLEEGRLSNPANELSPFFTTWFEKRYDDRMVLKYTPVHAALIAAGDLIFHEERAVLALTIALAAALTYLLARLWGASQREAAFAMLLLALSPLFLVQALTLLSYLSFLSIAIAGAAAFEFARLRKRAWLFPVAGFLTGMGFFARPYDMLLIGLAFYAPVLAVWPRTRSPQLRRWIAFGLGFAIPMLAMLGFNQAVTGHALKLPFAMDPSDVPGFGKHRMVEGLPYVDYTLWAAVRAFVRLNFQLIAWLCLGPLTAVMAFRCLYRRAHPQALRLGLWLVAFPIGYFFFWGSYTSAYSPMGNYLGPYYYLPMLFPLAILGARGFSLLTTFASRRSRLGWHLGWAACAALSLGMLTRAVTINYRFSNGEYERMSRLNGPMPQKSLVLVPALLGPQLLHPFVGFANTPALRNDPVFALNLPEQLPKLLEAYPQWHLFRLDYEDPSRKLGRQPADSHYDFQPVTFESARGWRLKIASEKPFDLFLRLSRTSVQCPAVKTLQIDLVATEGALVARSMPPACKVSSEIAREGLLSLEIKEAGIGEHKFKTAYRHNFIVGPEDRVALMQPGEIWVADDDRVPIRWYRVRHTETSVIPQFLPLTQ